MSANTSSAVVARRREPHDSLDDFPTPPWAGRALCEWMDENSDPSDVELTLREPAANRGFLLRGLEDYFDRAEAADIFDYGAGFAVSDYLFGPDPDTVDWTITNPPFKLAQQFIERALRSSRHGVAMLTRLAFLETEERVATLFAVTPPTDVLIFAERVVIHRGRLPNPNVKELNAKSGLLEKPTTATAYCWLVWRTDTLGGPWSGRGRTVLHWIPKCRTRLERPGDYDWEGGK